MNVKLLIGIVLFVIGLITAAIGIVGVGSAISPNVALGTDQNAGAMQQVARNMAIPVIAGLSLAVGGLLMGLSMGNWKHPRTHLEPGDQIVDPEGYHKMKHV